jgi:hypothetical protein
VKPAGLQAPRSCHGKFKKLMRKVETRKLVSDDLGRGFFSISCKPL